MKLLILTPFYFPDINGISYATLNHCILFEELNEGYNINIAVRKDSSIFILEFKNSKILDRRSISFKELYNEIRISNTIVLEGRNHPLHFLFAIVKTKGKKIFFSHGSEELMGLGVRKTIISTIRSCVYLLPNILLFRKSIEKYVLADWGDNKRFRDVLFYKRLNIPFKVIPNFSLRGNYNKAPRDLDFVMVGTPDSNKGFIEIVNYWISNNVVYTLDLYFPLQNNYVETILNLIKDGGMENINVHIGKNREEIVSSLRKFKVLLVNSRTECQSLVVIDAITNGLNILTTKTGKYFKEDEVNFTFFDRSSSESLNKGISISISLPISDPVATSRYNPKGYKMFFKLKGERGTLNKKSD